MNNNIDLEFNKSITRLAGNPYGREVFNNQVKDKIDYNKINILNFPDNIEKIASSFVQGFFAEIVAKIGYEQVFEKIKVKSIHETLVENIYKDLF